MLSTEQDVARDVAVRWTNPATGQQERLRLLEDRRTVLLESFGDGRWAVTEGAERVAWDRPAAHTLRAALERRVSQCERVDVLPRLRRISGQLE